MIRGVFEVIDVAVWTQAADDFGTNGSIDGKALRARRDFAVITDADDGLLAPDERPPGTGWSGTQNRTFLGERQFFGGVRGGAQFAVDFVLVGMRQQLVQEAVGSLRFSDAICGQQGREAFLPVIVAAFDFAFGLGSWGIAEGDAVEVQSLAQLGEGVGCVGKEERMIIDVERQRESVGFKSAREEVEVSQEIFRVVKARTNIIAGGIIQQIQQDLFVFGVWEEGVRGGVILPEGAQVADLPALDGLGLGFIAGVWGELVGQGPTTDTGPVGFEVESAVQFTGGGTVGGRWFGREQFGQQADDGVRPLGLMVAAREAGRPDRGFASRTGLEVLAVEFIKAGAGKAQFVGGPASGDLFFTMLGQKMPDQRSGKTFDQLLLFIAAGCQRNVDFSLLN